MTGALIKRGNLDTESGTQRKTVGSHRLDSSYKPGTSRGHQSQDGGTERILPHYLQKELTLPMPQFQVCGLQSLRGYGSVT